MIVLFLTMIWQHQRYASERIRVVQDQQTALYGVDAFHVVFFFKVQDDARIIETVSELVETLEEDETGKLIYVGQSAYTSGTTPISNIDWRGAVLMQYRSREDFDLAWQSGSLNIALEKFQQTYLHGIKRNQLVNLFFPQAMLVLSAIDVLNGSKAAVALEPVKSENLPHKAQPIKEIEKRLRALAPINDQAVLVFNLSRAGTPEQNVGNKSYGVKMATRMARGGHGPLHFGNVVTLEGEPFFDSAAFVYYPGANYFADLLTSTFFLSIIGDKQLGENFSMPTVPILKQVREFQGYRNTDTLIPN